MLDLHTRTPLIANLEEQKGLDGLDDYLDFVHKNPQLFSGAKLILSQGQEIELPDQVFQLLRQLSSYITAGQEVSIVPIPKELTTQEAADLLNVPEPYLVKLLEDGELAFKTAGTLRHINSKDLLRYKQKRDKKRHEILDKLTELNEELGLYDYD